MKKIFFTLLLLFSFIETEAKVIPTPYLKVKEVDSSYIPTENEKIEVETYYKQEKINKDYKYLEKANNIYNIKSNDLLYGKYNSYQKERINDNSLDEDIKTIYYYQELKKINNLTITLKNIFISKIIIKEKDNIIYEDSNLTNKKIINLSKKYSPEYLTIEFTCFLNQEDTKGSILIENSNYIKEEITVTKKGFSNEKVKLINTLTKLIYDEKIIKNQTIDNNFYINIIKKETLYRYRKKYYKFYKDETIISKIKKEGYKVIEKIPRYYLYRKETIETYDDIILNNYLDIDKVIKTSTIPTNNLIFSYQNNCNKASIDIIYKDFKEELTVTFICDKYPKSTVKKGKVKSLKRELFVILFNTFFLRKM